MAIEFTGRLNNIEALLESANAVSLGRDFVFRHGGAAVTPQDLAALQDLQKFMKKRFHDEVAVILRRTDQRA